MFSSKSRQQRPGEADSIVFYLHYRITSCIYVICSTILILKLLFGTPIECYVHNRIPASFKPLFDSYCLEESVSFPHLQQKDLYSMPSVVESPVSEYDNYAYNIWIPFALFLQGILFYIPRYIWKIYDGGLFYSISQGLNRRFTDEEIMWTKLRALKKYFAAHLNCHRNWAIWYVNLRIGIKVI